MLLFHGKNCGGNSIIEVLLSSPVLRLSTLKFPDNPVIRSFSSFMLLHHFHVTFLNEAMRGEQFRASGMVGSSL